MVANSGMESAKNGADKQARHNMWILNMAKKSALYLYLTGKLTGVPDGTTKPAGTYVYQKTGKRFGNIPGDRTRRYMVRRHVPQINPKTPQQSINRERFARGVAQWHTLNAEAKSEWAKKGRKIKLNSFQMFMREWCRYQPTTTPEQWDSGGTVWDSGSTIWF